MDSLGSKAARWKNIGIRSYSRSLRESQAFVFGAYCPVCLWAWAVYWSGGSKSGVTSNFRGAKKLAQEWMEGRGNHNG